MPPAPDDHERLRSLRRLGLLDSDPEERFDRITRTARRLFDVPVALVSLVDADRQWFKSADGVAVRETPLAPSFCVHAVAGEGPLVVRDAHDDPRFAGRPLLAGFPSVRFYAGYPVAAPDGVRIGTLCIFDSEPRDFSREDLLALEDLAAMVEHELAVRQLAVDDELTGLCNRRGFLLLATKALALCRRNGAPALLLYGDVDGLKVVNDRFGHAAGDALLREAAEVLDSSFRGADVIARVGGDEFAAFFAYYDAPASIARERIREAIAERSKARGHDRFSLSLTIGAVRVEPDGTETLEELIELADAEMYAARRRRAAPS